MLQTFKKIFKSSKASLPAPRLIRAQEHQLDIDTIHSGAISVVETLAKAGFEAYLVGGCVRDLMLGLRPKDFDVATNATPEEVKNLFRRSRIIGRRFQIVHVRVRSEIIEVTTFRGDHNNTSKANSHQSKQSSKGLLLRDNIFGTIEQDAARRDFTINALYYQPLDNTIYDFANGKTDIENRLLRIIGDAKLRYREDPVRMLRAIRFSAKLDFDIEQQTAQPILQQAALLAEIPAPRLFDESLKFLMNGCAEKSISLMQQFGLFDILFPASAKAISNDPVAKKLVEQALKNTDERIQTNKRVTPAFIYAALLWPVVQQQKQLLINKGDSPSYALNKAASSVIAQQCQIIAIPKRFTLVMREIWELQLRLPKRSGNRAERLLGIPRFRAGYDFLLLREQAGEIKPGLGQWWTDYQEATAETREEMVQALPKFQQNKRRRKKRRPASTSSKND